MFSFSGDTLYGRSGGAVVVYPNNYYLLTTPDYCARCTTPNYYQPVDIQIVSCFNTTNPSCKSLSLKDSAGSTRYIANVPGTAYLVGYLPPSLTTSTNPAVTITRNEFLLGFVTFKFGSFYLTEQNAASTSYLSLQLPPDAYKQSFALFTDSQDGQNVSTRELFSCWYIIVQCNY